MAPFPSDHPPRAQLPPYDMVNDRKMVELPPMAVDMEITPPLRNETHTPSTFSMDDIEVAKALTGLREASPSSTITIQNTIQPTDSSSAPQPLLTLLTSQHPLIASTINNSLSAYTTSKSYSTPFRVGAEFVERNIAQPVANTVGTASRMTGVETGVRWWLNRKDSGNDSRVETGSKRRRPSNEMETADRNYMDLPPEAHRQRDHSESSQPEQLPPYDDHRSPRYEEYVSSQVASPTIPPTSMTLPPKSWQTRFAIHTSGLGVAMSDESLKSLKYCLSWLRWANGHLSGVLGSLQDVLGEWERSQCQSREDAIANGHAPRDPAVITKHIQALKAECVRVLKTALDVVSQYAGGSLPENARWIVKSHLTSLPARFKLASQDQPNDTASNRGSPAIRDEESQRQPEAVTSAHKVIVLAKEGLDMIHQVTAVVDGTIVSAEEWIERLGRKRNVQEQPAADEEKRIEAGVEPQSDVIMSDMEQV